MTTVLLVSRFPPADDGIAVHARDLRDALSGLVRVAVLTSAGRGASAPDVFGAISPSPLSLLRCLRVLRERRPEVVHVQLNLPSFGAAWAWVLAAGLVGRRRWGMGLVLTLHEVRRDLARLGAPGVLVYRMLGRSADALVVYTGEARDLLVRRCGIDPGKVHVTPHGCRAPLARPDRRQQEAVASRYGLGLDPVLFLGYLHPDKGVEHLIEAAGILRREDPSALGESKVVIAGRVRPRSGLLRHFERKDRAYASSLHRAVDREGLQDLVHFSGPIHEDDLAAALSLARLAVLPYNDVTQSGVLNLLLSSGTPVVASRLPGLVETLGDAGRYFEPGDARGLARELRRVLYDDDLRRALAERMAAVGAQVSYAVVAARLREIYADLARGDRARSRPPFRKGGAAKGRGAASR